MQYSTLDGIELHKLFESGYRNLKKNMETVNALNVFPVPDGDTGTNMVMTFGGGIQASSGEESNVGQYMKTLSRAVLLSARGNSGVIFSQFVHGLARGFADKETVTFGDFSYAFDCAVEDAYKSLICPTEGTILTVIREGADFLRNHAHNYDLRDGFTALLEQMRVTLAKTPDLLPVLKEAGVVDSGGAGLVCFVEGILAYLQGESIEDVADLTDMLAQPLSGSFGPDSQLEYGYCTEFILQLMNYKTDIAAFDLAAFVKPLEELGDSIVSVCNDSIVKIHIHTFTPEKVLEYGRKFGEFVTLKIENMSVQHSEVQQQAPKKEHLKYAIVAVASGEGLVEYFKSIGANVIIDGGQTNNPSVDAFLDAFRTFDAQHIVVLPNNSNIVLTAQQAAQIYEDADVRVIPTKSIVEGYSALSMMNLWCDTVEELIEDMTSGLDNVDTGYVTTSIRDTQMDGLDVKEGDYIGLDKKHILSCGQDKVQVTLDLIKSITDRREKEVIIVFTGASATDEEVSTLSDALSARYPMADLGFIDGKMAVYDFIISLE